MRKLSVLAALVLILTVGVIPAVAITWGQVDDGVPPLYPNVGAILMDHPDWGQIPLCSGTLVHSRVFLTAGHCTSIIDPDFPLLGVTFEVDAASATTILAVDSVVTHPKYNRAQSNPRDVGVLILAESVVGIEPATLAPEEFLDELKRDGVLRKGSEGAKFTLVGYGGTLEWPPPDVTYEDQRQFAESEYLKLLKAWLLMSQNQATGDGGTCFGDSGGPAFYSYNGTEYLVGITSWGDAQCVATGFNYRVDIPDTLEFIAEVIDSLE